MGSKNACLKSQAINTHANGITSEQKMNAELIVYSVLTVLATIGLVGWVFELAGWEDKKLALWSEGKPKEKSLLHRFGFLLAVPMIITASQAVSVSGYSWLGGALILGTITTCFAAPLAFVAFPLFWEAITNKEAFKQRLARKRRRYR